MYIVQQQKLPNISIFLQKSPLVAEEGMINPTVQHDISQTKLKPIVAIYNSRHGMTNMVLNAIFSSPCTESDSKLLSREILKEHLITPIQYVFHKVQLTLTLSHSLGLINFCWYKRIALKMIKCFINDKKVNQLLKSQGFCLLKLNFTLWQV